MIKYLCVGNSKTGTTSLLAAMKKLGFKSKGFDPSSLSRWDKDESFSECLEDAVNNYEFLKDWPWVLEYERIHRMNPDVKFILTLRDEASWVNSFVGALRGSPQTRELRKKIYKYDVHMHLDIPFTLIRDVYRNRNEQVREYARKHKIPMLELRLEDDYKLHRLCGFLQLPTPKWDYPYENVRTF